MKSFPLTQADFYKVSHKGFMHEDTKLLYANLTPRSGKYAQWYDKDNQQAVFFGLQHFIKDYLIDEWNREFFHKPKETVIAKFKRRCDTSLGDGAISMTHFEVLHDLGYLPITIKALPEGSLVDMKVPVLTLFNTHEDFAWLVTYLETVMSAELWQSITSATTAYQYKQLCDKFADETVGNRNHVMFQCHDFSMRGMAGRHAAAISGAGHLLSFSGTDTIPAIDLLEDYYGADATKELIGASVPASEHSVTSLGISVDGEFNTLKKWITECYPTGIVSLVSDTLDYWKVLTTYLPQLKEEVLARKPNSLGLSKVVVRPDSGDPVDIICGTVTEFGKGVSPEEKGSIELLWETFGGTVNEKGFKELDSHVGLIYGDSITLERAREIFNRLAAKGFASSNVVFGVGSFSYQMVSRDTLGMAIKATYAKVGEEAKELYKDPVTDNGTKKSARGLLRVVKEDNKFVLLDQQEDDFKSELKTVFIDGELVNETSLQEIRSRLV